MKRHIFPISVTLVALALSGYFLASRGRGHPSSLALYSLLGPDAKFVPPFLVESFDLKSHKALSVKVEEVFGEANEALPFKTLGPVVTLLRPLQLPTVIEVKASNEVSPLEARWVVAPASPITASAVSHETLGWPIRKRCGEWEVVLLSEGGVPAVDRKTKVLALFQSLPQPGPMPKAITLSVGREESTSQIEPGLWAMLTVRLRTMRTLGRLSLLSEEGKAFCEADVILTGSKQTLRVEASEVDLEGTSKRLRLEVSSLEEDAPLYGLLASATGDGDPSTLLEVRLLKAEQGLSKVEWQLPGLGLYRIRLTKSPLSERKGVDLLVAAMPNLDLSPFLKRLGLAMPLPREALGPARPFIFATVAASSPLRLEQYVNTSDIARTKAEAARKAHDLLILGAIASCLFSLLLWAIIRLLKGQRLERVRARSVLEEGSPDLFPLRHLWMTGLLVLVVTATIVALVLVLRTL